MAEDVERTVVCIEDEPEMIDLIRLILARKNFRFVGAVGGREGLDTVRQLKPDLVLLDLMMPDMDGFAVLDELKADEQLKDLPVIVITAKELTATERQRLQGRIQMLLQKGSFMDEDLLAGINALLGREKGEEV